MAHSLPRLPSELLQHICELLSEVHAPSLLSFALANKYCHSIATALLFRRITFRITTPERLREHTQKCIQLLRRNHAFRHVRHLVLVGFDDEGFDMNKAVSGPDSSAGRDKDSFDYHHWHLAPPPTVDWEVNHQRLHGIPDYSEFFLRYPFDRSSFRVGDAYHSDPAWMPLAELVGLLPGLTDLIHDCPAQIPPCLLQALHHKIVQTRGPITRLHLRTFKLRMLYDAFQGAVKDPHELAIITSPCLSSVWLRDYESMRPRQSINVIPRPWQAEALEQIIKFEALAPNLREVRVMHPPDVQRSPCTWIPAEIGGESRESRQIALEHLELSGTGRRWHNVTDVQVQYWNNLVDLSALQTLTLTARVIESGLDELLSLRFPALTEFTIHCLETPTAVYLDKVKRFIRGLSRLESLCVKKWDWSVAPFADPNNGSGSSHEGGTALSNHNPALHTLWLENRKTVPSSIATPSEIARLAALYPNVENLTLPVRRSKGDSAERALYQAIASSFPRLRRLALILDASPPRLNAAPRRIKARAPFEKQFADPSWHTNGDVMDVMVNSALDARLARQIFQAVGSSGLETMMVRAEGGMELAAMLGDGIQPWLNGLARMWVVDRLVVGSGGEERVREIGENAEGWRRERRQGMDPLGVEDSDADLFSKHFRKLWPGTREGSRGWFDDWESWPLAEV